MFLPAGTFAYARGSKVYLDVLGVVTEAPVTGSYHIYGFAADSIHLWFGSASATFRWNLDTDAIENLTATVGTQAPSAEELAEHYLDAPRNRLLTTSGLVDMATLSVTATGVDFASLRDVSFSPDGTKLFAGYTVSPWLRVYDTTSWVSTDNPFGLSGRVDRVSVSPDGGLVSLGLPSIFRARTYSYPAGSLVQTFSLAFGDYYAPEYSQDGLVLAWVFPSETVPLRFFSTDALSTPIFTGVNPSGSWFVRFTNEQREIVIPRDSNSVYSGVFTGAVVDPETNTFRRSTADVVGSMAVVRFTSVEVPEPFWTSRVRAYEVL